MHKKILLLSVIFIVAASLKSSAQFSRYIIRLKDKGTNPYSLSNPIQFLTQRSINRRARYNIPIDSADLPVTPRYIDSIKAAGAVTILNTSKWLNQVAIRTNDAAALVKINSFPFVISAAPIGSMPVQINPVNKILDEPQSPASPASPQGVNDFYNYGSSYAQVHIHNGEFLHNHGFRGQGMQLAVLDAGFFGYLSLPTFDSVRNAGQILGTWDFVDNHPSVNEDHQHGMNCLSTIAANLPGVFVGQAPKASFYLYRTEDVSSEYPIEEQNWAAGAERADSLGADIISTSLGYTSFDNSAFNYTYAQMDGNTTISARAADFAAKKGMLPVTAAGNDGNGSWHFIATPADADSTLTVGAVSNSGAVAGFSSYGPSSDGQIKPTLAAVGQGAIVANPFNGQPSSGNGTSFACPNLAGITTCLWQAFPEVNNMVLLDAMKQSATRFTSPDDRVGYGIPDMKKSFVILYKRLFSLTSSFSNCKANLQWTGKSDTGITFILERKLQGDTAYTILNSQTVTSPVFTSRNFSFQDDLLNYNNTGNISYRMKVKVSADTTFYADSVTVNYPSSCIIPLVEKITVSPNPVSDKILINVTKQNSLGPLRVIIYAANGQRVYTMETPHKPGHQVYTIPAKQLNSGVYYVSVYFADKKELVKKIVKQ